MSDDSKSTANDKRRLEILAATLRLLRQEGSGISTAQIAAEARCSKETLYNWFGDREGILMALISEQARSMHMSVSQGDGNIRDRLVDAAARLLDVATGEALLTVNWVAMADTCRSNDRLGAAVRQHWEQQIGEAIRKLVGDAQSEGLLAYDDQQDAIDAFYGLLIGDRQRRMLLGSDIRMDGQAMNDHARIAVGRWISLFSSD